MKHTRVVRIVNVTEVKNKFGEIIERVYASNEDLIVERGGIPVVAIIPISVYQKNVGAPPDAAPDVVQRVATASERAESSQRLGELFKNVHAQMPKVDEEEAERLINAEVTRMRAARRKPMKARPTRERSRRRVRR